MTDRAEIERLLNQTGRTLEGLPTQEEYCDLKDYGDRCEELDRALSDGGFESTYPCMFHQSDVIELLVGALRDALDKPMQKPLTLEELHALIDTGEEAVTYCEAKDDPQTYACIWYDGESIDMLPYEHYGIGWRAWTNRPTDEERGAAAWES